MKRLKYIFLIGLILSSSATSFSVNIFCLNNKTENKNKLLKKLIKASWNSNNRKIEKLIKSHMNSWLENWSDHKNSNTILLYAMTHSIKYEEQSINLDIEHLILIINYIFNNYSQDIATQYINAQNEEGLTLLKMLLREQQMLSISSSYEPLIKTLIKFDTNIYLNIPKEKEE